MKKCWQLYVYVPSESIDLVKQALFDAGAGRLGNYQQCCWQTQGQGQFLPNENANPTIGDRQTLSIIDEIKIECLCEEHLIKPVITALKHVHPYEEPAFGYWPVYR